jgi:hypothetical protein
METAGRYRFQVAAQAEPGVDTRLHFVAWDRAGNESTQTLWLRLLSPFVLHWLLPPEGLQLPERGQEQPLQVALRWLEGTVPAELRLQAQVAPSAAVALTRAAAVAGADVLVPAAPGRYRIEAWAEDAQGQRVAAIQREIEVVAQVTEPLTLTHSRPEAGARDVQPNQAIELFFNHRPDPTRLQVTVRETLHGRTWVSPSVAGGEAMWAADAYLDEVHRDFAAVTGRLEAQSGGWSVGFYAARDYGFGAQLDVQVAYDGRDLGHFSLGVRPLPTYLQGAVVDQFGQPVAGIAVQLPGLDRTVRSGGDGGFAFGYQTGPETDIPGGQHALWLNGALQEPRWGSRRQWVTVQSGVRNDVGRLRLPALDPALPFTPAQSGQAQVYLAQGDVRLDLSAAQLQFPDGRERGDLQMQFHPLHELAVTGLPGAEPLWAYAAQPQGIGVTGPSAVSLKLPQWQGRTHALPEAVRYVLLLGLDAQQGVLVPVGVGRVAAGWVHSQGAVWFSQLDYVGVAAADVARQPLLQAIAEGRRPLSDWLREAP